MIGKGLFLGRNLFCQKITLGFAFSKCSYGTLKVRHVQSGSSLESSFVKKVNSLLIDRNIRYKEGRTVLKNSSLVKIALANGIHISDIIYRKESSLKDIPQGILKDIKMHQTYKLPTDLELDCKEELDFMIALCEIPQVNHDLPNPSRNIHLPVNIILDNIRNYENMGIVIQLFERLGCQKLLLTRGCVDIWNPKTIESAKGTLFTCHSVIKDSLSWTDIGDQVTKGSKILLAEAFKACSEQDGSIKYTDVDYNSFPEMSLVIGGETEGLSENARGFCKNNSGYKIYIPIQVGIDSLNGGMAAAILLSEISRQMNIAGRINFNN